MSENSAVSANLTANDDAAEKRARRKSRKSFGGAGTSPAQVASPRRKLELKAQCKEAVRLANQGKVNRKNAWNMPLKQMARAQLDEEGTSENGVNFQHASLTLDALSTIYGYRIDETHANTQQFQQNLTRTGDRGGGGKDDEGDGGDSDDEEGKNGATAVKKLRVKKNSATVADNARSLCFKQPELEFDIDPLFHQMSSKFDQGGGAGMLLNNLGVAQGCTIVFDGSVTTEAATEAPEQAPAAEEPAEGDAPAAAAAAVVAPAAVLPQSVDVGALCASVGFSLEAVVSLELCPPLNDFYQQREQMRAEASSSSPAPGGSGSGSGSATSPDPEMTESEDDDYGGGDEWDGDNGGGDEWGNNDANPAPVSPNAVAPFAEGLGTEAAPAPNSVLSAMQLVGLGGSSEFDFFDHAALDKIWAGPKYGVWKRSSKRKPKGGAQAGGRGADGSAAAAGGAEGGKRQRKKAFFIDFFAPPAEDTFKPAKNAAATQLSALVLKKHEREAGDLRLPVDLHYKPRQLVQLNFNPELRFRRRGMSGSAQPQPGTTQEACLGYVSDGSDDNNDVDGYNSGGGGDNGVDQWGDDVDHMPLPEPERVEKTAIHYETKLKKVNVKKLKLSLWSNLGGGEETPAEERAPDEEVEAIEAQSFTAAIGKVSREVPSNVTVPFYFISLLHLANEHGLELADNSELSDLIIARN